MQFRSSLIGLLPAAAAAAETPFFFSTGDPDGKIATATRPDTARSIRDRVGRRLRSHPFDVNHQRDLHRPAATRCDGGAMSARSSSRSTACFRKDSDVGRTSGSPTFSTSNVPTRVNSPSDIAFQERDAGSGLTFSTERAGRHFTALNSVQPGGIHPLPGSIHGRQWCCQGEEVQFTVTFTTPFLLAADHYFFVPQVQLDDGDFLWLSAPKPIVAPGHRSRPASPTCRAGPAMTARGIDPDWLRIGTDITHQGPFNAAFSLRAPWFPNLRPGP